MEKMGGNGFLDVNIMYPEKENVRLYENFSERFGSLKMRINTKVLTNCRTIPLSCSTGLTHGWRRMAWEGSTINANFRQGAK